MLDLDERIEAEIFRQELTIAGLNEAKQLRAQGFDFNDQGQIKESMRVDVLAKIREGPVLPSDLVKFFAVKWIDVPEADNRIRGTILGLIDEGVVYQNALFFLYPAEQR